MEVADLRPNPQNPRKITDKKRARLKKTMLAYGDLSGIVYNEETSNLVGGHQRKDVFGPHTKVVIENKYDKPTGTGTVARGYILLNGERFNYRQVKWPRKRELAANLAANKHAGDWDNDRVGNILKELSAETDFDVELTGFDEKELEKFSLTDDDAELEERPQRKYVMIKCPHCKKSFEESRGKPAKKK